MKPSSSILWALLVGASLAGGCGGTSEVRTDWEAELAGALSLSCHNIDHLGYGMHYDIVFDNRQAQQSSELLVRQHIRRAAARGGE